MKNSKYSLTYIGNIVAVLALLFQWLKIPVGTPELTTTVTTLVTIAGFLVSFYGRFRLGDINWMGVKK